MEKVALADVEALAKRVLEQLSNVPEKKDRATILAFSGDLGAGKTTFTQALAKVLGVIEVVQSPTYILMKSYALTQNSYNSSFDTLVHIDAYRLEKPEEFAALKPEVFLNDPRALIVVEWPERVAGALPAPDVVLKFSSKDAGEGERYIERV